MTEHVFAYRLHQYQAAGYPQPLYWALVEWMRQNGLVVRS